MPGLFGLLLRAQQLQERDVAVVRAPFGLSRRIVGAASGTVRGVAGAEIWTPSQGNPSAAGWLSIISCSLLASGNAAKALEALASSFGLAGAAARNFGTALRAAPVRSALAAHKVRGEALLKVLSWKVLASVLRPV